MQDFDVKTVENVDTSQLSQSEVTRVVTEASPLALVGYVGQVQGAGQRGLSKSDNDHTSHFLDSWEEEECKMSLAEQDRHVHSSLLSCADAM